MTNERIVAIVDDRKINRERQADYLRDKGFEPHIITVHLKSIPTLLLLVNQAKAMYALCDHRLNEGDFANFFGAEAVAAFYDNHVVSPVLYTAYRRDYLETSIRRYRRKIPAMVHYEDMNADTLEAGFLSSHREVVEGIIPKDRQPFPTLMKVLDIFQEGDETIVKVVVPQWDPSQQLGFPLTMLPSEMQSSIHIGSFLRGNVNVDAKVPEDIFFEDFSFPHPEDLRRLESERNHT